MKKTAIPYKAILVFKCINVIYGPWVLSGLFYKIIEHFTPSNQEFSVTGYPPVKVSQGVKL